MSPASSAPSARRPPGVRVSASVEGARAGAPRAAPRVFASASAMASFRPGGYAAACAASARPAWSRPYATSGCASAPCVQSAMRSAPTWGESAPLCASVVYLRARAPSAHCASVTDLAPAASSASRMQGSSHIGAWSAMRGHHAGPAASP
eukprot:1055533-Pleurochrysis_carterae.AAC.1